MTDLREVKGVMVLMMDVPTVVVVAVPAVDVDVATAKVLDACVEVVVDVAIDAVMDFWGATVVKCRVLGFVDATEVLIVVKFARSEADVATVAFFAVLGFVRVKIMVACVPMLGEIDKSVVLAILVAFAAV